MREALFSAARAVVEGIARRRPLVLAIDDIHWADEGMLDLIDHLTRWVRAPLLLVCLTRDELLERRPGWGGGRRNATTIALEPLTDDETRELVAALMPADTAGSGRRGRRASGRRAGGRESTVRRGDGQPADRGGHGRGRRPAEHGAVAARGQARLPRSARASPAPVGLGDRSDVLGGRPGATAAEEGLDLGPPCRRSNRRTCWRRARGAVSRVSASTPSSTC